MTTTSDIAGLSERLEWLSSPLAEGMSEYQRINAFVQISGEVKTALDSLTARVKELEAEVEKWHRVAMKAGVIVCENGGLIYSAADRALRAEQQRDEIQGALDRVARVDNSLAAQLRTSMETNASLREQRDEAYERAAKEVERVGPTSHDPHECILAVAAAIRRLASGPEGGAKPQESKP